MSYWDKVRKKEARRKVTQEVLNAPEFKEYMRQHEEQAVLNALGRFCIYDVWIFGNTAWLQGSRVKEIP